MTETDAQRAFRYLYLAANLLGAGAVMYVAVAIAPAVSAFLSMILFGTAIYLGAGMTTIIMGRELLEVRET